MGTGELAKEYFQKVFPHFGIPDKIISDKDPCLTSELAKAICREGDIQQNISTTYHPQTNEQSEWTNQTLETFLRIFCSHQQDDWAKWLPFAQYALNSRPSMTTKIPPFEALIGVIPKGINLPTEQQSPWDRITELTLARKRAYEAILYSQMLITLDQPFKMYKEGEQVWLEAKNLKTMHPSHKLRARRYGPFKVTKAFSHVTYQLELPHSWKIHNVFHTSYLSPFKETIEHGVNFLELPPDIVEGQPEWEVEEIVSTRLFGKNKKRQYWVR